jgi:hypothetical protein
MRWSVEYYDGSLPLTRVDDSDMDWNDLPVDGVVFVTVYHDGYRHQMRGYDNYWVDRDQFGCFNDQNSPFGAPYAGQRWMCDWNQTWTNRNPPRNVHVLRGVMLTDDVADEIGLL